MIRKYELLEYMNNLVPEDKRDDEIVKMLMPIIAKGIILAVQSGK